MSRLVASLAVCVLAALAGCGGTSHSDQPPPSGPATFRGEYPIKVVCTTGQVAEMITQIGGEHVHVDTLMGPGVDPHLYRPIASDVRKLDEADAIFYNGMHLEGRMSDLFVKMARTKATFAVTEGLQSRNDPRLREPPEFEGMYDPHVWHDVALWSDCIHDMADALSKFDPAHAEDYRQNAADYLAELQGLDEYCKSEIAKIPAENRILVTAHDAFGYFGKAYGLEVFGLKGISTDEEKDVAHQEELQAMIIDRKVPAVFVESAVSHRTVEALIEPCRAAGHDLKLGGELYADALGPAGTPDSTYVGMIRHNVRTIVEALAGDAVGVDTTAR
jgi:manganese/zinc/iron transport system substrate-binding protein